MDTEQELAGCQVVVTRPADQAEPLAEALRQLGARVRVRPLISIAAPIDPARLRGALARLGDYDWVAFTSANAVRACAAVVPAGSIWPRAAAVGPGTARAAAEAGIQLALVPGRSDGEALARALTAAGAVAGTRVLWPRAREARVAFAAVLRSAGALVDEVECYRTEGDAAAAGALAAELGRDPADVLLFTAPSAVRTFALAAEAQPNAAIAVIGSVTGGAAAAVGWQVEISPADQSIPGLVAALRNWWSRRR